MARAPAAARAGPCALPVPNLSGVILPATPEGQPGTDGSVARGAGEARVTQLSARSASGRAARPRKYRKACY